MNKRPQPSRMRTARQEVVAAKSATIRNGVLYWQAPSDKESLFAALEDYANLQRGPEALNQFRLKWPDFFPSELYDASGSMESEQKLSPLAWYLKQLRAVWRGVDGDEARLGLLLGFYGPQVAAIRDAAFQDDLHAWEAIQGDPRMQNIPRSINISRTAAEAQRTMRPQERGQAAPVTLGVADAAPDWKRGAIEYKFNCDFQQALYALMRESWRARICRNCERYFIADKPPQMYCSTKCFGMVKGKRSLEWWRAEGSDRRRRRTQQAKASRRTKR